MSCMAVVGGGGGQTPTICYQVRSSTICIFRVESGVATKYRKHAVVGRQGSMTGQYHLCESLPNHCIVRKTTESEIDDYSMDDCLVGGGVLLSSNRLQHCKKLHDKASHDTYYVCCSSLTRRKRFAQDLTYRYVGRYTMQEVRNAVFSSSSEVSIKSRVPNTERTRIHGGRSSPFVVIWAIRVIGFL